MPNLTHLELMLLPRHGFAPYSIRQLQRIATDEYKNDHIQNIRALNMRTAGYYAIFWNMYEELAKPAEVQPAGDVPGRRLQGDPRYGNSPDLIARWQVDIFDPQDTVALYAVIQLILDRFPRDFQGGDEADEAIRAFGAGERLDLDNIPAADWIMANPYHTDSTGGEDAMPQMGFKEPARIACLPQAVRIYLLCNIIKKYVDFLKSIGDQGRYPSSVVDREFNLGWQDIGPRTGSEQDNTAGESGTALPLQYFQAGVFSLLVVTGHNGIGVIKKFKHFRRVGGTAMGGWTSLVDSEWGYGAADELVDP
ncbi:unnamed protein product [Zymoseptoria tritici ST99CH_1E4]|uniref:Uncharacterized protein n=1 Tax=Zymoseptoria tritici ST99CH_1E4 TaxID=1276532 RepID=A0A2H1G4H3_ZYMTR|nr:unnamed protein product [Zymoseptoria tritici ST99CH_1E4]